MWLEFQPLSLPSNTLSFYEGTNSGFSWHVINLICFTHFTIRFIFYILKLVTEFGCATLLPKRTQDGRPTPALSLLFHFGKDAFLSDETVFSQKICFFIMFSTLSNFESFFPPKYFIIKVQKIFLRKNTSWYAFYENSASIRGFEKNQISFQARKNPSISQNSPKFLRFEKYYCFSRTLRQMCYNLVKNDHVQKCGQTSWTQLASMWYIKGSIWAEEFPSIFCKYGGK